ncbi:uncharacterized protein LOC126817165 [Patella vulgata]|uniref:uncharacterized protein LOC126817165 n=1 Tax=Patella vulgata TaxID=6465 RepID=UPI0021802C9D|nr:uncharacterized protein LOC126817165 [Patella vulgata]
MEKEGLRQCLTTLDERLNINVLATDRHIQVGCMLRKDYPNIIHQYDVWHVSKSLIKKLSEKAKSKQNEPLKPWIQSIRNHFWWCVTTCDGNIILLKEKWISVLKHCSNIHEWTSNEQFHQCEHPKLSKHEEAQKMWLKPGSAAFQVLQDIVLDKSFLKVLEKLTLACHTGDLEVYHSMMLKYCPKRQHFSFEGMVARTQLAALDHNNGVGTDQAIASSGPNEGTYKYNQVFPKRTSVWVAKPIFEKKTYDFKIDLMARTVEVRTAGIVLPIFNLPVVPENIASVPKPPKDETVRKHRSRMSKSILDESPAVSELFCE